MSTDSFRDFVPGQLPDPGNLSCKRMFSGYGLCSGEFFFGIVSDGRLYPKTQPDTPAGYLACQASVFPPSSKQILKNYREIPADILKDSESLMQWAHKAAR